MSEVTDVGGIINTNNLKTLNKPERILSIKDTKEVILSPEQQAKFFENFSFELPKILDKIDISKFNDFVNYFKSINADINKLKEEQEKRTVGY